MKKLLLSICMLASMHAHAQWQTYHNEADELTGEKAFTAYTYTSPVGSFTYTTDNYQYVITTATGIFDYESSNGYRGQVVHVGLYDTDNNLKDKFTMWLDTPSGHPSDLKTRNAGTMANPVGQKSKVKKMITHLEKTDGHIRIVAPVHGKPDFDIAIPSRKQ